MGITPALSKEGLSKKLILGFAAIASAAVVSVAGMASADTAGKPSKADCQQAGFSNYGQCVKEWAQAKKSNGYGGTNTNANVDTNVNLEVNGNNNVIHVIINYFFG